MNFDFADQTEAVDLAELSKDSSEDIDFRLCEVHHDFQDSLRSASVHHWYLGEGGGEDSITSFPMRPGQRERFVIRIGTSGSDEHEWVVRWEDEAGQMWESRKVLCEVTHEDAEAGDIAAIVHLLGARGARIEKPTSSSCPIELKPSSDG